MIFPGVICPQRRCSFYSTCPAAKTNGKLRLEKQRGPASHSQPRVNGDQEKSSQHFFFLQMILRIKKNLTFTELSWCFLSERLWDDMLAASMNSSDKQLEQRKFSGDQGRWSKDHSFQLLSFRVPYLLETTFIFMVTLVVNVLAAMCFVSSPEATVGLYC